MAPSKTISLADQLADLEDPTPKGMYQRIPQSFLPSVHHNLTAYLDFDPEDLEHGGQSSDDDEAGKPTDVDAGREHYEAVGYDEISDSLEHD